MAEITKKESDDVASATATKSPRVKRKSNKKRTRSKDGKLAKAAGGKRKKFQKRLSIKGSGLMHIKHLPKGFNEPELRQFFKQFGDVARVYLARSKKTQQCKGYGYVHFRFYEVAEIAASAVNNYMMFGRVLKAAVLPKKVTKVPRNFGRAFNSKGEQTGAYRKWLQSKIRHTNRYLGPQTLLDRVSKRMKRLERAEQKLREAGIDVPETNNCMSKIMEQTKDLKEQVEEALAKKSTSNEQTEMAVDQEVEDNNDENSSGNDDDDDDEDEETAFSSLKPSDWHKEEPTANEAVENVNVEEAVKKAREAGKEFELAKRQANKPVASSNKENKKALPAEKQPENAKQTLSKKKQSGVAAVPSLKTKAKVQQKTAVAKSPKVVKSAKLVKKVK